MISSDEYSPFMSWNPDDPITVDFTSSVINSLVSMIRDNYQFDEELLRRASTFLGSFNIQLTQKPFADDLMKAIGRGSPHPAAGFVDSVMILLSSFHPSIFGASLSLSVTCFNWCSLPFRSELVSSKIILRMLTTPRLRDLSAIEDKHILKDILDIHDSAAIVFCCRGSMNAKQH
ncbi:hypothetical protein BLNAU_14855 [Blattamonas nauphoetae]|uniref:Uncharacterized protein n=1 Tax=Blattamonas nauphoetae TaxID=2049346 RepID=A0ABQ9XH44_9EUKA|nr:hypothetical protein BLNAU_14855 [Blattamonas nauphoetae]